MNIKIDIADLMHVLDNTPAEQNIMLSGGHGIGKSEILTKYFSDKGMKVVALFLGQMSDPGDLIGLPDKSGEVTVFRPPYWFPVDGKPIVLFLDELNRARPEVLQTVMDLTLNRKLAGRKLPEGSRVIAAVNEGEEYQLTDLDPALVSRFNIYSFEPTVEEWTLWATEKELDRRVIDFIRDNPLWLDRNPIDGEAAPGMDKTPDRRAWKYVSDVILNRPTLEVADIKLISGIVGVKAANLFASKITRRKLLEVNALLDDCNACVPVLLQMKLHDFQVLNEEIFETLTIGKGLEERKAKVAANLTAYIDFLDANDKREVFASFAFLLQERRFARGADFIAVNCPGVFRKAYTFTSSIR
ncbi:MAG: AAA family ATPase [Bacteroidales bacterium]|nr:AAA family ATPase [Bacteroidales bacterium]